MSTRAIIGIKNANGTITGAWQWNDGDCIASLLNKNFNTLEKAMNLIAEGVWSTMYIKNGMLEYEDWLVNSLYKDNEKAIPYRRYVCINGIYLLKNSHHENREPETYQDFKDAAGQDINHIYLFNPNTNKWVKDKDIL